MTDAEFEIINRRIREMRDRVGDQRLTVKCVIDPDLPSYIGFVIMDTTIRFHPVTAKDFDARITAMLQGRSEQEVGIA